MVHAAECELARTSGVGRAPRSAPAGHAPEGAS
jgi:hypothetical protein